MFNAHMEQLTLASLWVTSNLLIITVGIQLVAHLVEPAALISAVKYQRRVVRLGMDAPEHANQNQGRVAAKRLKVVLPSQLKCFD